MEKGSIPPLWDGKASDRIVKYLIKILKINNLKTYLKLRNN